MLEERALVVSVDNAKGSYATVQVQRQSACETCQSKAGCGSGALARISGGRCMELTVANELGAEPGDIVLLALPEQGLMAASLLMYLLPLLLLVFSSMVAKSLLGWPDGAVAMAGVLALASGFVLVRRIAQRAGSDQRFRPRMIALEANLAEQ